jgi:hypothetical protein
VSWIHDISQTALAGAVLILGLVIMLELRSIVRLRRLMDGHLARVFEQLDLLRYENQQLLEARSPAVSNTGTARGAERRSRSISVAPRSAADAPAVPTPARPTTAREVSPTVPLAAGEARLLASLAAARARRELPESSAPGSQARR